ncbi:MAG: cyclic nucleotide-binding domain-containing protein [Deltaproteobacteria bacterium]|nr:cyclic nucleotide-binding domain-containing protein [Deltaproteobacteria bacterium]
MTDMHDVMITLFSGLDAAALAGVRQRAEPRDFDGNVAIIREGEPGDALYIIVQGTVAIIKHAASGRGDLLGILGRGEYVGEMALLTVAPRSASVITLEPVKTLAISHAHFGQFVEQFPGAGAQIFRTFATTLSARLQRVTEKLGELLTPTAARASQAASVDASISQPDAELSTPAAVLKGTVDLLSQTALTPERRQEFLRTMTIQAERLVGLLRTANGLSHEQTQ